MKESRILPYILILCFSFLFLSNLLFSAHWTDNHEYDRYLTLMEFFKRAFTQGFLYPRWMTDMYGGYGYPTFVFYQPMFFFLSLPFNLLLKDPFWAVKITVLLLFFIGGAGAYKVARLFLNQWGLALAASIFYLLTPYLYVDLYVRGALGELCVLVFIPWVFYFLLRLERAIGEKTGGLMRRTLFLGVSLAAVLYSHLPVSMIFFPTLSFLILLMFLFMLPKGNKAIFLACSGIAIIIGFVLSAPYWFLCLSLQKWVHWDLVNKGPYDSVNHIVHWGQFFANNWGFGGSGPGPQDGMSFQLGLVHFLIAAFGFILGYKQPFIRFCFILYMLLLIAMGPAWIALVKVFPLLGKIQFPWRILSITMTLQMITALGVFIYIQRFKSRWQLVCVAILLVLIGVIHFKQFIGRYEEPPFRYNAEVFTAFQRTHLDAGGGLNEFLPRTAPFRPIPPRVNAPVLISLSGSSLLNEMAGSSDYKIHYKAVVTKPDIILINQLYFPGWRVEVNGRAIEASILEVSVDPLGRMAFELVYPGVYDIKAYYAGPPRKENVYAGVLLIMVFLVGLLWILEKRKS